MKLLIAKNSTREAHMLGAEPRDAANDGDLTAADLAEIDAAMLADKKRNRYDSHREESAWQAERRDDDVRRGTT